MTAIQYKIQPNILTILSACVVDDCQVTITGGLLDQSTYKAVNKVLELMGGKWNKKTRTHVFSEHPGDLFDSVILTGEITDKKKMFQEYVTPEWLCCHMVESANIDSVSRVLEPSAGYGAILRMIGGGPDKVAVELNPARVDDLIRLGVSGLRVHQGDFLSLRIADLGMFDAVIMNPPFTRGQDIRHILHARTFLKPHGRLVGICANGPKQREVLASIAIDWEDLPAGTFAESGTNVSAALLVMGARA